jgi:hypothetical protein
VNVDAVIVDEFICWLNVAVSAWLTGTFVAAFAGVVAATVGTATVVNVHV